MNEQIPIRATVNALKQEPCFQWWPLPIVGCARSMLRDQQLVGVALAQHFDSHQHRRHHQGVQTVYSA